jgi:hypothetical protein
MNEENDDKPKVPAWLCRPDPEYPPFSIASLARWVRYLSRQEDQEKAARGECAAQWCHQPQDRDGMCTEHAFKLWAEK